MLDGIRTRNPQIRSLMRYPLRHEHVCKVSEAYSQPRPTKHHLAMRSVLNPGEFRIQLPRAKNKNKK